MSWEHKELGHPEVEQSRQALAKRLVLERAAVPRMEAGSPARNVPSCFLVGDFSGSFSSGLLFSGDFAFTVGFFSLNAVLLQTIALQLGCACPHHLPTGNTEPHTPRLWHRGHITKTNQCFKKSELLKLFSNIFYIFRVTLLNNVTSSKTNYLRLN